MLFIFILIIFVFGLIIGSFLNVVICRFNTHRTFGGRSACMSCQSTLCWYDLIPLFSFIGLKGRCRVCKSKISWQYPLVEFATGVMFVGLFYKFGTLLLFSDHLFIISFSYFAVIFSLLIVIAVYDFIHKIIPDILVLIFVIFSFAGIFLFQNYIFLPHIPSLFALFEGLILAIPFALIWVISRGVWMGLGDAKLAVGIGYLIGLGAGLSSFVVASVLGSIIGIILILTSKKYGLKTEIPFAPFLVLGTFIAFICNLHLFGF